MQTTKIHAIFQTGGKASCSTTHFPCSKKQTRNHRRPNFTSHDSCHREDEKSEKCQTEKRIIHAYHDLRVHPFAQLLTDLAFVHGVIDALDGADDLVERPGGVAVAVEAAGPASKAVLERLGDGARVEENQ